MRSFDKLLPHLCLAQWGMADMETIIGDAMLCRQYNIPAISVLPTALSALHTGENTKIFCFLDDTSKLDEFAERKDISVQLFLKKPGLISPDLTMEIIPAFALKNTTFSDWNWIMDTGKKLGGFMFIDNGGKYMHRFYSFLDLLDNDFKGTLHYCAGTNDRDMLIDAYRLVDKVHPDLLSGFRIFVSSDFFVNCKS